MSTDAIRETAHQHYESLRRVTERLRELAEELGPQQTPLRTELRLQRAQLLLELGHRDLAAQEYARCVLADPGHLAYSATRAVLRARLTAAS